jgi:hypothetical protein
VGLVILPSDGLAARCRDEEAQHRVAAARGIRITFDTAYSRSRDILRVTITAGRRVITPIAVHRGRVHRVTPWGPSLATSALQRIDLPLDELAGDSTGLDVGFVIEVWHADDAAPDRVRVQVAVLDSIWGDHIESRALAGGVSPDLAARLDGRVSQRSREERRVDDLAAAARLATAGDERAARYLVARTLDRDPCLSLQSAAGSPIARIEAELRRRVARCEPLPLAQVALRGAILPGFGRPVETPQRRLASRLVFASVVGSGATAILKQVTANAAYDRYKAVGFRPTDPDTSWVRALAHYDEAESARSMSRMLYLVAGGLWIGAIAEGVLRERGYATYLDRLRRDAGQASGTRVGVSPMLRERGLDLALHITLRPQGAR